MPSDLAPRKVFVGREAEQREFASALVELVSARKRFWRRARAERERPRVFLVHGEGGMGKRRLLGRLEQLCAEHGDDLRWLMVDWKDLQQAGSVPGDLPALTVRLHNTIAAALDGPARKHFKDFVATHEAHGAVREKVAGHSAEYGKFVSAMAPALGLVAESAVPVPPALGKLVSAGVEGAARVTALGLETLLRKSLSDDEYRLHTTPDEEYARHFVRGLVELSRSHPVVIAQAEYEWVASHPRLDHQWRALVLKPILQQTHGVAFVNASRVDLGEDYRESLAAEPPLLHVTELGPFTAEEIRAAYQLEPDMSERIHAETSGIPLNVAAFMAHLRQTGREPSAGELAAAADGRGAIRKRFLRYLVETPHDSPEAARQKRSDRHRIYALALLRQHDLGALAACWGALEDKPPLPYGDTLEQHRGLRQRLEFLFEPGHERMQAQARQLCREELRQKAQVGGGSLDRGIILRINQAAADYYRQALAQREASRPHLAERVADAEWRSLAQSALEHAFWLDPAAAERELVCRVLEAATFDSDWLAELHGTAAGAQPSERALLASIEAGIAALRANDPAVRAMWDAIRPRLSDWKLPPVYRALLADRVGRLLCRLDQPGKGADELRSGLDALAPGDEPVLRRGLVDGMAGAASMLVFGARDYPQGIAVARQALSHDPDHRVARHVLVLGLMGARDWTGTHQLLDELIAAYPDALEFRSARYSTYLAEGRKAEAARELEAILEKRPQFAEDTVRLMLERRDPKFHKAMSEWGQDVGWSPAALPAMTSLHDIPPDVLTELMTAVFRLNTVEKPSAEEVLAMRELFARRLPDWPGEQIALGIAYLAVERLADALRAFERAHELAPDDAKLASVPGLVLFWHGHHAEALGFLETSARLLPDNPGPQAAIVSSLQELGRLDEARSRAEAALAAFPDSPLLRWIQGGLLIESGDVEKGWQVVRDAYLADRSLLAKGASGWLLRPPGALEGLKRNLVAELEDVGEILVSLPAPDMLRLYMEHLRARLESPTPGTLSREVLVPFWQELLAHRPESAELRLRFASTYEELGKLDLAIGLLTEIADRPAPLQNTLRHRLARLHHLAGDSGRAMEQLAAAVEPFTAAEHRLRAALFDRADRLEDSLGAHDAADALEVDEDPESLALHGMYNLTAGRFRRAEELFERQLARQPDVPLAYLNMAEALRGQGKYAEARVAGERVLALAPDSTVAAARLHRIAQALGSSDAAARREQALRGLVSASSYDQACTLAILGMVDDALARLADAIRESPEQRAWARRDPDLRELHASARFQELVRADPPPPRDEPAREAPISPG